MPPVASEATTHAFRSSLPNPTRAAQDSERAQGSPFASLLDDGTQTTSEQAAQSPVSGDKPMPTALPDLVQVSAQNPRSDTTRPGENVIFAIADFIAAIATAASFDKPVSVDKASAAANSRATDEVE